MMRYNRASISHATARETFSGSEWLLLRRCNLSNIDGRVYVRVRIRVRVRVIFSIT